jgi:hypothetical protein
MGFEDLRRSLSCTRVWGNVVSTTEDLESWVTLDAITLAEVSLFCAIDLGEFDILLLQCGGSLLVLWSKCFAVSTGMDISNLMVNKGIS